METCLPDRPVVSAGENRSGTKPLQKSHSKPQEHSEPSGGVRPAALTRFVEQS